MRNWKLDLVLFLVFAFGAAIISRLFFLQILNSKFYQAQALGQQAGFSEAHGYRGEIFSRNSQESRGARETGEVKSLAVNKDEWLVSVVPQRVKDMDVLVKSLSESIGESEEFVLEKIENQDSYTIIKKGLPEEQIEKIKKLNLEGISLENNPERYYPQETLASNVTGFLGGDDIGQYGIEGYYDEILEGKKGIKEQKKGLNLIISGFDESDLNGSDLYLTIDYNIQFEAESLLKEAKANIDIDSGQIIVLKPDSGRILAMANFPSFNPNQYSRESNLDVFQNASIQKLFEPGSVLKPFTMAIALNEGKISPDTAYVDEGFVKIGIHTIHNFNREKYGQRTMTEVLEKSINTGAVFASQQITHKTYLDYMQKFGFFEKTGIDLQGEAYSQNESLKNGSNIEFATASFGQGIGVTPIQLARAFSAIANGGRLAKPYVVEKIAHGSEELETKPQISDQIISQKTVSEITSMLISVVDDGLGDWAKIPGYYIAGKTGTAEVAYENQKGYYSDKTIQSFIGFAPALNPQFLILVKLDNPKVPKSSLSAVPIFKKLAQYIINYWKIPPDYDINK